MLRKVLKLVIDAMILVWILIIEPAIWLIKWAVLPVRYFPWHATVATAIFAAICIGKTYAHYDPMAPHQDFWFYAAPAAFSLSLAKPLLWLLEQMTGKELDYEQVTQ